MELNTSNYEHITPSSTKNNAENSNLPFENENRLKLVRKLKDVNYFFDFEGNSPNQTSIALSTFNKKVILIAGGYDDNASYDSMGDILVEKIKHLILFGQTTAMIEMCLMNKLVGKNRGIDIRITHCSTLKQAVDCAFLSSKPEDTVLLSPAGSCVDIYNNTEELYEVFEQYVAEL